MHREILQLKKTWCCNNHSHQNRKWAFPSFLRKTKACSKTIQREWKRKVFENENFVSKRFTFWKTKRSQIPKKIVKKEVTAHKSSPSLWKIIEYPFPNSKRFPTDFFTYLFPHSQNSNIHSASFFESLTFNWSRISFQKNLYTSQNYACGTGTITVASTLLCLLTTPYPHGNVVSFKEKGINNNPEWLFNTVVHSPLMRQHC